MKTLKELEQALKGKTLIERVSNDDDTLPHNIRNSMTICYVKDCVSTMYRVSDIYPCILTRTADWQEQADCYTRLVFSWEAIETLADGKEWRLGNKPTQFIYCIEELR